MGSRTEPMRECWTTGISNDLLVMISGMVLPLCHSSHLAAVSSGHGIGEVELTLARG